MDLLWTGGWDSTFRLLEVVLDREHPVRPWYVRDAERASTPFEKRAMADVREGLRRTDAAAAARVLDPVEVSVAEVEPDPAITGLYRTFGIGSQYDWLARFADQRGLSALELGAVKGGGNMYRLLWDDVEPAVGRAGPTYRLVPEPSDPNLELFRRFEFPILHRTKVEMRELARERGWAELMARTWFCFQPRGGKPCGSCAPCVVAVKSGMGGRIPPLRRIRPRLRLLKRALLRS